ncbi:hypothetical protein IFM89_034798 [Coptis chinensis]|uniref:Uncharacterized protein n=1 Tax=Coptis chinensis TaxID=261450 RepID=A0A835H733_9MAGN|nr:hypothetical protein IFM89_034798 [Coptis chinensis]
MNMPLSEKSNLTRELAQLVLWKTTMALITPPSLAFREGRRKSIAYSRLIVRGTALVASLDGDATKPHSPRAFKIQCETA